MVYVGHLSAWHIVRWLFVAAVVMETVAVVRCIYSYQEYSLLTF